ncbi:hypothetical protein WJX72_000819 [[Myrmecia] bisecta]|uniref:Uncharacterized protein n=1 Tax=[Myrmecia] bisecta TaxID=41462 RepID=A0AAW1Q8E7_9CHLO
MFLVISPTLLAVVDYLIAGKLLSMSEAQRVGCLRPSWIARIFSASDVLTLLIQFSGAGMLSQPDAKSVDMGINMLLAGLAMQLVFFAIFTCLVLYMHISPKHGLVTRPGGRQIFFCLYASIALLFIRNTYRVVEFAQGWTGFLAVHEGYFYGFDTALVFLCILVLTVLHPGYLLPKMAQGLPTSTPGAVALVAPSFDPNAHPAKAPMQGVQIAVQPV